MLFAVEKFEIRAETDRDKGIDFHIELKKELVSGDWVYTNYRFAIQLKATNRKQENHNHPQEDDKDNKEDKHKIKIKMIVISIKSSNFVCNNKHIINIKNMNRKKQIIYPKYEKMMEQMGENIKLARKRRKLTTVQLSERADIARSTLYLIEQGNSGVAIGAYFNVLRALGLQEDFLKLAADDAFGRKLQDLELL